MKNLKKWLYLIALCIAFTSCENDLIEETAEANNQTIGKNLDMVTFSSPTGNVGTAFSRIDGKSKVILNLDEAQSTTAKFLYVDTDQIKNLQYSYQDLLEWSYKSKIGLIFESATANHLNTQDFYTNEVGGTNLNYMVEGLVVEQSQDEDRAIFVVLNNEIIDANHTIEMFFNDLYERRFPTVLDSEPAEDLEFYDNDNPKNVEITDPSEKGLNKTYNITYNNISQSSAESKVKALLSKPNTKFVGFKDYKYNLKASIVKQENEKTVWLKQGNLHNASGKCSGQQTASYGQTMAYAKTWSTSFSLSTKVGPVTFGGSFSYGGSTTKGTANTSSLSMKKQYAQGGVACKVKYCTGYTTGDIKFKATGKYAIRTNVTYNVTLKFSGKSNKWTGWRQKTKEAFSWSQWGSSLKKC